MYHWSYSEYKSAYQIVKTKYWCLPCEIHDKCDFKNQKSGHCTYKSLDFSRIRNVRENLCGPNGGEFYLTDHTRNIICVVKKRKRNIHAEVSKSEVNLILKTAIGTDKPLNFARIRIPRTNLFGPNHVSFYRMDHTWSSNFIDTNTEKNIYAYVAKSNSIFALNIVSKIYKSLIFLVIKRYSANLLRPNSALFYLVDHTFEHNNIFHV